MDQQVDEHTRKHMDALTKADGYTVLPGLISPEQAADVRHLLMSRLDDAQPAGEGNLRLGPLARWGEPFQSLVTHPTLLSLAYALLGEDATLGAYSARILMPGCPMGALHVDYPYWAMNPGMPVTPALMLQVIWMMEPFTETNGGTWVAPGSQLWPESPEVDRFHQSAVQATGNAGDAVVSHGLLWHRTAENHSDAPRVAILINYTQLTVQPMAPLGEFQKDELANMSPQFRSLLGVDYGKALGRRLRRLPGTG